jgi:peptidoglycan hydrolase-like protein with peptidoglycan-binding domain
MTRDERDAAIGIKEIQEALKRKGYYHGKIDGKMNKRTEKALTQWQIDIGLPTDSNTELFQSLGLLD